MAKFTTDEVEALQAGGNQVCMQISKTSLYLVHFDTLPNNRIMSFFPSSLLPIHSGRGKSTSEDGILGVNLFLIEGYITHPLLK